MIALENTENILSSKVDPSKDFTKTLLMEDMIMLKVSVPVQSPKLSHIELGQYLAQYLILSYCDIIQILIASALPSDYVNCMQHSLQLF